MRREGEMMKRKRRKEGRKRKKKEKMKTSVSKRLFVVQEKREVVNKVMRTEILPFL